MTTRLLWQALAALVGIAILCGLGAWQLQRLQWKEDLIARVTAGLAAAPVPPPAPAAWPGLDVGAIEYRRVSVRGHFLYDKTAFASAALTEPKGPRNGFGLWAVTPLQTDGGWIVYVNRGFVPRDLKASSARPGSEPAGEVTVTGPLRAPYDRDWFAPGDDPARNEWFSHDPGLYAAAGGLAPSLVAPYLIDAEFDPSLPGGLPQGGETIVDFPNSHLGYAITWFGLAAALAAVFGSYAWRQLNRPRAGAEA